MYKTTRLISQLRCMPGCGGLRDFKLFKIRHPSPFRAIHTSVVCLKEDQKTKDQVLPSLTFFEVENKNKETYNQAIELFKEKDPRLKGHVEFIYAALKYMEEFGVEHDLESYKNILRVLPKDKMVPTNVFQSEFMYFPKQQYCAIDVLETMERKGIIPDTEVGEILKERFGKTGIPVRKHARMMYWMPKFKHANPWPVPRPTPTDAYTLAMLAIERITSVDLQSVVSVYNTKDIEDAVDDTWIVSGQSPAQQRLLNNLPQDATVQVEGPFLIWLRNLNVQFFTLRTDPLNEPEEEPIDDDDIRNISARWMLDSKPARVKPEKTVHEQDDGIILGVCATGTSSRDSLLSWIRLLERHNNPRLASIPVLFKIRSSPPKREIVAIDN